MVKNSKEKGFLAESAVLAAYRSDSYRLLMRNFRTRMGEIDLVVARESLVVFVEVRSSAGTPVFPLLETVHSQKRSRCRRTASLFLQLHADLLPDDPEYRFDVVTVTGNGKIERFEGEDF